MSFKLLRGFAATALLLAFGLGASGCGLLKEPKEDAAAALRASGPECLSTITDDATNYFAGKLQRERDVEAMCGCAASSLEYFTTFTRGASPDSYSAEELQRFLNHYLPADSQVSTRFMAETMKLKRALFGGDADRLTRQEFQRIVDLIRMMTKHFVRLRSLMPASISSAANRSDSEIDDLISGVQSAGLEMGQFFQRAGGPYSFTDAEAFIAELEKFWAGPGKSFPALKWVREQMPLIAAAKAFLMGSDDARINRDEWSRLLSRGAKLHGLFVLLTKNEARFRKWDEGSNLDAIERTANFGIGVLLETTRAYPDSVIPFEAFRRLIDVALKQRNRPDLDSAEFSRKTADVLGKALLFKELFLGNRGKLDAETLKALPDLMAALKGPLRRLAPYLPGLDLERLDREGFEQALAILGGSAGELGSALLAFHSRRPDSYEFDSGEGIFKHLAPLFQEKRWNTLASRWESLGSALKGLMLGQPNRAIEPAQWFKLVRHAVRGYLTYQTYAWYDEHSASLAPREKFDLVFRMLNEGLDTLAEATQDRPLLFDELAALVDALPGDTDSGSERKTAARDLLPQLLRLKQAIAGGQPDRMTSAEVAALRDWAAEAHGGMRKLAEFWPLSLKAIRTWDAAKTDALAAAIEFAGNRLAGGFPRLGAGSYSVAELDKLLRTLEHTVGGEQIAELRRHLALLGALKSVLVAGPHTHIGANDWSRLFAALGRWASWGIQAYQFWESSEPMSHGPGLERLVMLTRKVLDNADLSIQSQGTNPRTVGIPFTALDKLIEAGHDYFRSRGHVIGAQPATISAVLRPIVEKALGAKRASEPGQVHGLTTVAIQRTRAEFDFWLSSQRLLGRLYAKLDGTGDAYQRQGFTRAQLLQGLSWIDSKQTTPHESLRGLIERFLPQFAGGDDSMSFLYDNNVEHLYSFHNMTLMNAFNSAVRILVSGFVFEAKRAEALSAANLKELQLAFADVWPLLTELKIFHKQRTVEHIAMLRFREADIFLPHSNGNGWLDYDECVDLIALLWSAWPWSTQIHRNIASNCPQVGKDDRDRPTIDTACYRGILWDPAWFNDNFGRYLPRLAGFLRGMHGETRERFIRNMEAGGRIVGFSDAPTDSSDTEGYATLFHYMEAWFKRYDLNRSGSLEMDEALGAFPTVCRELDTLSPFDGRCPNDAFNLEALYAYILVKGTPPGQRGGFWGTIGSASSWYSWRTKWWSIRKTDCDSCFTPTDRGRFADILAALSE